ncbi:MAG: efflux RND transporter periplasmic adaptor subunit [Gammaproteobacteria bacterium]
MKPPSVEKQEQSILYWVAPMNPNYRSNEPGKSPMGMDLIPVYESDVEPGEIGRPIVKIAPEMVNNLGVRTITVKRGPLSKEINTVGYLEYDETRISHIHTRTEGWIEKLIVRAEGERVKKGQLLFEIYSPLLVVAQEEYIYALKNNNESLIEKTRERLISLGVSKKQISRFDKEHKVSKNVAFYAPQAGVLTKLGVRDGMFVKPETEVLRLADLNSIWLFAEVFERQANWVKIGQRAEATLPSMPGKIWEGEVEYIYPDLDPVTRTLRVRLQFDNPNYHLMPNMYAHVMIHSDKKEDVVKIPREALIRESGNERVILALGNGRFQARNVTAGIESGEYIEIKSGLEEGDVIVVTSQFLIDSESSLKASLRRMQPQDKTSESNFAKDVKGNEEMISD